MDGTQSTLLAYILVCFAVWFLVIAIVCYCCQRRPYYTESDIIARDRTLTGLTIAGQEDSVFD